MADVFLKLKSTLQQQHTFSMMSNVFFQPTGWGHPYNSKFKRAGQSVEHVSLCRALRLPQSLPGSTQDRFWSWRQEMRCKKAPKLCHWTSWQPRTHSKNHVAQAHWVLPAEITRTHSSHSYRLSLSLQTKLKPLGTYLLMDEMTFACRYHSSLASHLCYHLGWNDSQRGQPWSKQGLLSARMFLKYLFPCHFPP